MTDERHSIWLDAPSWFCRPNSTDWQMKLSFVREFSDSAGSRSSRETVRCRSSSLWGGALPAGCPGQVAPGDSVAGLRGAAVARKDRESAISWARLPLDLAALQDVWQAETSKTTETTVTGLWRWSWLAHAVPRNRSLRHHIARGYLRKKTLRNRS